MWNSGAIFYLAPAEDSAAEMRRVKEEATIRRSSVSHLAARWISRSLRPFYQIAITFIMCSKAERVLDLRDQPQSQEDATGCKLRPPETREKALAPLQRAQHRQERRASPERSCLANPAEIRRC